MERVYITNFGYCHIKRSENRAENIVIKMDVDSYERGYFNF